jgi:hypothetical protein
MIPTRTALAVALLLMLALIPTVIHSYLGLKTNDSLSVSGIHPVLANFSSEPSSRLPAWGQETFGCYEWFERIYTDEQGKSLRLFVGRSYDHKRLYHHPELAISYGKDLRQRGQIRLPKRQDVPVNVLKNEERHMMAAFALLYDGQFIDNPVTLQIRDSVNALISPRKAMTLFYIADDNASGSREFSQTAASDLLTKAIEDFLQQPH